MPMFHSQNRTEEFSDCTNKNYLFLSDEQKVLHFM